jgi:hypothetical protein
MMGENELGQGLAHMMAAPANLSGQGMLDNSMAAPTRQHVSDAAWEAQSRFIGCDVTDIGLRGACEVGRKESGTVLLTVAECDELLRGQIGYGRDVVSAIQHYEVCAERDSLRAEVERLRTEIQRGSSCNYELWLDNERLRKGREDYVPTPDQIEKLRATLPEQTKQEWHGGLLLTPNNLDPRLGTQLPEGEPVGPMSQRKPYRWGMV